MLAFYIIIYLTGAIAVLRGAYNFNKRVKRELFKVELGRAVKLALGSWITILYFASIYLRDLILNSLFWNNLEYDFMCIEEDEDE